MTSDDKLDPLLTTPEVAKFAHLSTSTMEKYRCYGGGPPYIVINKRVIRYKRSHVIDWLNNGLRTSTSNQWELSACDKEKGRSS